MFNSTNECIAGKHYKEIANSFISGKKLMREKPDFKVSAINPKSYSLMHRAKGIRTRADSYIHSTLPATREHYAYYIAVPRSFKTAYHKSSVTAHRTR